MSILKAGRTSSLLTHTETVRSEIIDWCKHKYILVCVWRCWWFFFWFPDIAIAAPYGGEDKRGLVYIYNGGAGGLNTIPSQILEGQWAGRAMPPSFGYSLKGATDVDKNGYPGPLLQISLYSTQ